MRSALELAFDFQLKCLGLEPEVEYIFAPPRRWRFDYSFPDKMIAVELEGGVWSGGRHTRPGGFTEDCHKYNAAAILGWSVIRLTADMVYDGSGITLVEEFYRGNK